MSVSPCLVAAKLVQLAEVSGTGESGLLLAVYLATFIISNVVTNNAAVGPGVGLPV